MHICLSTSLIIVFATVHITTSFQVQLREWNGEATSLFEQLHFREQSGNVWCLSNVLNRDIQPAMKPSRTQLIYYWFNLQMCIHEYGTWPFQYCIVHVFHTACLPCQRLVWAKLVTGGKVEHECSLWRVACPTKTHGSLDVTQLPGRQAQQGCPSHCLHTNPERMCIWACRTSSWPRGETKWIHLPAQCRFNSAASFSHFLSESEVITAGGSLNCNTQWCLKRTT